MTLLRASHSKMISHKGKEDSMPEKGTFCYWELVLVYDFKLSCEKKENNALAKRK